MGGGQHNRGRLSIVIGTKPIAGGYTPSVARHEPREVILRHGSAEVIAYALLVGKELGGYNGTDRMTS